MNQSDEPKLFTDFPPLSTETWEEKIREDLKGGDYEKKLVWKPFEGLNVKPYYRMEDLENLSHLGSLPGEYPFVRGNNAACNNWEIRQEVEADDIKEANRKALVAISRGAAGITFNVGEIDSFEQMSLLLKDIDLTKTAIHFKSSFSYSVLVDLLINTLNERKVDSKLVKGSFNFDSIAYYTLHREFYNSAEDNFNEAACLIGIVKKNLPQFRVIKINGQHFNHAGANAVHELAWALSSASEYFSQLTERKIDPNDISSCMQMTLATGSDYFLEIARIRAARMLWARMAEQYGCSGDGLKSYIHCIGSQRNKTVYDPWVNQLRSTTETMSAAIAGADAITSLPINNTYRIPDAFAVRVARNNQIILKEESNLNKVVDPGAGSYYIENLTDNIASMAWDEFVKVESMGGFLKAFESGYINQEVEKSCNKRETDVATRKTPILGTNIFPNLQEEMLLAVKKETSGKNLGGLKLYRDAESFEKLRLATEKFAKSGKNRPAVLLVGYGNLAMRKARVNFASNFFGVAGYEILEEFEALNVKETVYHIMETDPAIIVYCSSDDEYTGLAVQVMAASKTEPSVVAVNVIAGYPKEIIETLKSAGADDFIHVRINLLESLTSYHKRFNII